MIYVAYLLVLLVSTNTCIGQYLHCGMGHIEWMYFRECPAYYNIFDNFFDQIKNADVGNGDEFLSRLATVCSDPSAIARYNDCVNNVVTLCPEQASDIESHFSTHLALFCEGNNVSVWLRRALQDGYSFDKECFVFNVIGNITVTDCSAEVQAIIDIHQNTIITFSEGMAIKQRLAVNFVRCIKEVLEEDGVTCGSSWQDALFTILLNSAADYPFLYAPAEELEKIKAAV